MRLSLEILNRMDQTDFTEALGWIFEYSPWVAERVWVKRPFASISELHQTMVNEVNKAAFDEKLALLRAHPDLAARVKMAEASVKEQTGAGLDQLTKDEREEFLSLNKAYTTKFHFPFILAVRSHTKETILAKMKERLHHSQEAEFKEALEQIYEIAYFRLQDFIAS